MACRDSLSGGDREIIAEALRAVVEGPFLGDDQNFKLLTGLGKERVRAVATDWMSASDETLIVKAVNQALLNLVAYPNHRDGVWDVYLSVTPQEVLALSHKVNAAMKRDDEVAALRRQDFVDLLARWPAPGEETSGQRRVRTYLVRAADRDRVAIPDELRRHPGEQNPNSRS